MKAVRNFLVSMVGLSVSVLPSLAKAEESKPFVVATVSKVGDLQKDTTHLLNLAGVPQYQPMIDQVVTQLAIDKTKPLVVALWFGKQGPSPVVWFPTTDGNQTLQAFKNKISIKKDGQFWVLDAGFKKVFATEKNGYLVFGLSSEQLKNAGNPPAISNRLANNYRFAVSLNFQNVPKILKQQAGFWIERQLRQSKTQRQYESKAEFLGRQFGSRATATVFKTILDQGQELTFGVKLTPLSHRFVTELKLTAVNGSNLEKQLATLQSLSRYHRLLSQKSPFSLAFDFNLPQQLRDLLARQIESKLEEKRKHFVSIEDKEEKNTASFQQQSMDLFKKHLQKGRMNLVVSALPHSNGTTSLFGVVHFQQAKKLEQLALEFFNGSGNKDFRQKIKTNVASHQGIKIHEIETPVADRQAAKIFGHHSKVFVAFADDEIVFTFGSDGIETIKNVLDKVNRTKEKPVSSVPFQFQVRSGFWVSHLNGTDEMSTFFKENFGEKDRISFTVSSIPRGVKAQFIIEEDYLRMSAKLYALLQKIDRQAEATFNRVSEELNK